MKRILRRAILISFFSIMALLVSCTSQVNQPSVGDVNNKAKLVITRSQPYAAAFRASVSVNNRVIGKLGVGGVINWYVPPGQTVVSTSDGFATIKLDSGKSSISFNAQAGKTYHLIINAPIQLNLIEPAFEVSLQN